MSNSTASGLEKVNKNLLFSYSGANWRGCYLLLLEITLKPQHIHESTAVEG